MKNEKQLMSQALSCARRAAAHDDVPIGAVVVCAGRVIARGENRVQKNKDATQHAEIVAIRSAAKKLGRKFLDGCEIYITLEPCAMCAAALSFARIGRVVFAARDEKGGGILNNARIYETDRHLWKPAVSEMPEYAAESAEMLKEFFRKKRG